MEHGGEAGNAAGQAGRAPGREWRAAGERRREARPGPQRCCPACAQTHRSRCGESFPGFTPPRLSSLPRHRAVTRRSAPTQLSKGTQLSASLKQNTSFAKVTDGKGSMPENQTIQIEKISSCYRLLCAGIIF